MNSSSVSLSGKRNFGCKLIFQLTIVFFHKYRHIDYTRQSSAIFFLILSPKIGIYSKENNDIDKRK
jgi:hypothetical protein